MSICKRGPRLGCFGPLRIYGTCWNKPSWSNPCHHTFWFIVLDIRLILCHELGLVDTNEIIFLSKLGENIKSGEEEEKEIYLGGGQSL